MSDAMRLFCRLPVCSVQVRPCSNEQPHDFQMTIVGSLMQRRPAYIIISSPTIGFFSTSEKQSEIRRCCCDSASKHFAPPLLIHTCRFGQQKILNHEKLSISDSIMNVLLWVCNINALF